MLENVFYLADLKEKPYSALVMMSNLLKHCDSSVPSHNLEIPYQNCSGGTFLCQKVLGHEKWRHGDFNKLYIRRTKNQNETLQTENYLFLSVFLT